MIVAHGLPSNDIITKCMYRYVYVAGISMPITYTNNLSALHNCQDIVNVSSGAISTYMEA